MTATIDAAGLHIQTFDEVFDEIVTDLASKLSLTPAQEQRIRASVKSTLGQLTRQAAEREVRMQEALALVYDTLSWYTEGAHLERVVRLLGVNRAPAVKSRVTGTATGTAATEIVDGKRVQYNPDGSIWRVVGGPYTIDGDGKIAITIEAEAAEALEPALDPDVGFDDWTILDSVPGWSDVGSFASETQPVVGAPIEKDASVRSRAAIEAYRRGQGPTKAIEASVRAVAGNTYVRVYHNRSLVVDADGIDPKSIAVIAVGGADADIAAAMHAAWPAGGESFAFDDASRVDEIVVDEYGIAHPYSFNRVVDVDMWVRVTLTTSTSETQAPTGIRTTVADLVLAQAPVLFGIGDDVLPWKLAGAIYAAGLPGLDNVQIELSLDGLAWSTAKRSISIREQAAFDAERIIVQED